MNHSWRIYTSSDYPGTVSTVCDGILQNQVMRIQSSHRTAFGIAYGLSSPYLNIKRTDLSMKYCADDGVNIYIRVLGKNGTQYYLT